MNEHGFLPKTKREDLDERLTRRLDQWYERVGIVPDRWQEGSEVMPWEPSP